MIGRFPRNGEESGRAQSDNMSVWLLPLFAVKQPLPSVPRSGSHLNSGLAWCDEPVFRCAPSAPLPDYVTHSRGGIGDMTPASTSTFSLPLEQAHLRCIFDLGATPRRYQEREGQGQEAQSRRGRFQNSGSARLAGVSHYGGEGRGFSPALPVPRANRKQAGRLRHSYPWAGHFHGLRLPVSQRA